VADNYIVLRPRKQPELLPADGPLSLDALKDIVGGWIETVVCTQHDKKNRRIALTVNEEGLLERLPPTVTSPWGVLVGPVIIGAIDGDEFVPLTPEEQGRVHLVRDSEGQHLPDLLVR
jgi:hypothetical protein